jgi:arylsulfatase A-like enzyme
MENRFANALRYADQWLGEVVATLERGGVADRTLLVVVGDHGEAFYEHEQPTHGTSLHEEQVRSLLLLRAPGAPPREIDEPVSLLDVAPTVLRVLGLPRHGNFQGRDDLLEPSRQGGDRAFAFTLQGLVHQDGWLHGELKLIVDRDRGSRRLYDLASDPGERRDLSAESPDLAAALEAELDVFLARQLDYYEQRGWERGFYPPRLP